MGWRTVKAALASAWSAPRAAYPARPSKLDPFKPVIDQILLDDLDAPRKQRHTITRIFDRLSAEHGLTDISYAVVRSYVITRRPQIRVEHKARTLPAVANATLAQAQARNSQLRARFPARPVVACWPETTRSLEDTARRLTSAPFLAASPATRAGRRHGVDKLLRWLSTMPGES